MLPDPDRRYVEFTLEIRRNGVVEEYDFPSLDALDRAWRGVVSAMPDADLIEAGTAHLYAGGQLIGDRHARYFWGVAERRPADGADLEPYEIPATDGAVGRPMPTLPPPARTWDLRVPPTRAAVGATVTELTMRKPRRRKAHDPRQDCLMEMD